MIRYRVVLSAIFFACALVGCGGGSGGTGAGTAGESIVPLSQAPQVQSQMLGSNVTKGGDESLYVQTATAVYVYPLGAAQPSSEIANTDKFEAPGTVAVSPVSGDVYVAGFGRAKNQVRYYSSRGKKLLGSITGLLFPYDLTFDSKGNLYVVNGTIDNTVSVFAPGSSTAAYTISFNTVVGALTVDSADNLYAQDGVSCATLAINVYARGSATPAYSITSGLEDLCVDAMTVDQAGNLYLADPIDGKVVVYTHGSTRPSYTITNGITNPFTLGVDSDGNLYVGNFSLTSRASSVSVYAPGASRPTNVIDEGVDNPISFAFGQPPRKQNLYVANFDGPTISSYAPDTDALLRTVAVPQRPLSIAIGK